MPFPVSRNRVDKLGEQLADEGFVRAENRELFSQVLEYYEHLLDIVVEQVSVYGYNPTTRVKTTGTLIEKLRREHGIKLSRIQDVAGARIISGPLQIEQDRTVAKIVKIFEGLQRGPSVIDRRKDPRYGYRAVHVIVYPEGVPVEIQVRTTLQNLWAQIFENLADQWGRQIRYGGCPDPPNPIRMEVLQLLKKVGEIIAGHESTVSELTRNGERFKTLVASGIRKHLEQLEQLGLTPEARSEIKDAYVKYKTVAIDLCCMIEKDKRRRRRMIRRRCPSRENPEFADVDAVANWIVSAFTKWHTDIRVTIARQEGDVRSKLAALVEATERGAV